MLKEDYLAIPDVNNFIIWLRGVIAGTTEINFQSPLARYPSLTWQYLSDVLPDYTWPLQNNPGPVHVERMMDFPTDADFHLHAYSSLQTNKDLIQRLSAGLKNAFKNDLDLKPWLAAIFILGDAYEEKGFGDGMSWLSKYTLKPTEAKSDKNKVWLHQHTHLEIRENLIKTSEALKTGNDDLSSFQKLRFNAGMAKVYSILLDDFIIYDSRVAGALAWLVWRWQADSQDGLELHPELAFQCIAPQTHRGEIIPSHAKQRNPDPPQFKNMTANPYIHVEWNLRANWILTKAFQRNLAFTNLHDVEAALFTMGYDLQSALRSTSRVAYLSA